MGRDLALNVSLRKLRPHARARIDGGGQIGSARRVYTAFYLEVERSFADGGEPPGQGNFSGRPEKSKK